MLHNDDYYTDQKVFVFEILNLTFLNLKSIGIQQLLWALICCSYEIKILRKGGGGGSALI